MHSRRRRRLMIFTGGSALQQIPQGDGTPIGDMINAGGLGAAFDGITNQTSAATANKGANTTAFIGKTLSAPRVFGRAQFWGSSDQGFLTGTNTLITFNIRGKNGLAPASPIDGTIVGTLTDNDDKAFPYVIESTDLVTAWDHIFLEMTWTGSLSSRMAELVLFQWG